MNTQTTVEEKENKPNGFIEYQPGNLELRREQIRQKLLATKKTAQQEKQLDEMHKILTNTPKKISLRNNENQKPKQQTKRPPSVPKTNYQEKFSQLHKKEAEKMEKFKQQQRRQTIARSPRRKPVAQPLVRSKTQISEQDTTFVTDPSSLQTIMNQSHIRSDDVRASISGGIRPTTAVDQLNLKRMSLFGGNSARVIPPNMLYGSSEFDRRGSFFIKTPMKTPDRLSLFSPRVTPGRFDEARLSSMHMHIGARRNLDQQLKIAQNSTSREALMNMLEKMNDEPPQIQQQIRSLLNTLKEGSYTTKVHPTQVSESQTKSTAVEEFSLPVSRRSLCDSTATDLVYEPSDIVKKLLNQDKKL
jgi:hypothetical protein